jgi:peptide/nickel transport system permease protein
MTNYLIRRSFQMIAVVILSTMAIYLLLNAVPGGPLSGINLGANQRDRFSDVEIAQMEAALGLNKPMWLAYLNWVLGEDWLNEVGDSLDNPDLNGKLIITGTWVDYQSPTCQNAGGTNVGSEDRNVPPCREGILRGDFGLSWRKARGQPVLSVIGSRVENTVILMTAVTIVSLLVAIPIGIFSAVRQYTVPDYIVTTFSFFGTAMPVFWFGMMVIFFFGLKFPEWGLPGFPTGDVTSTRIVPGTLVDVLGVSKGSIGDRAIHLFLPTAVLSLLYLATWSRYMRGSMLEVLRQDYVRTARAKGLREKAVVVKHAARNALLPLITIVVFQIPGIFSGAIITETIFNYPGMGRLFIDALGSDDWPIVMAILFISAILTVIATLIGDILYTVVDPRISFE